MRGKSQDEKKKREIVFKKKIQYQTDLILACQV